MSGNTSTIGELGQIRYRVTCREGMAVRLFYGDRTIDVELIELSLSGAKFYAPEPIPDHETVELRIQIVAMSVHLKALATIRRCERGDAGKYYVRCSFLEEISESQISRISAAGHLERRLERRSAVSHPVCVHSELTGKEGVPGSIVEYSVDGCRLLLFSPIDLSARLLVKFGNGTTVAGRGIWQKPCELGQLVGCTFLDARGYDVVRRQLEDEASPTGNVEPKPIESQRSLRLAPWVWMGLFTVVVWFIIQAVS